MVDYRNSWLRGQMHAIDDVPNGATELGSALKTYSDSISRQRQSLHWMRSVKYIENIFFGQGRQYHDDLLISRIAQSNSGDLSVVQDTARNIPKPTNDLLGRYIETNIALLTENRPRPRVTPKSDRDEDIQAANLSELTLEFLWEMLEMPEKHREIARLLLYCGTCWMEVAYDPTKPRYLLVPETKTEGAIAGEIQGGFVKPKRIERQITITDEQGRPKLKDRIDYGDVVANIISPFEMHMPSTHWWHDQEFGMGWVMRETYAHIDTIKDKYLTPPRNKAGMTKTKGWHLDNLEDIKSENPYSLPLWWWERISELVEGPGPNIYIGSPDQWDGYAIVRVFDRKPNAKWPKGRTIISVGDSVIYDSPKEIGARAFDPRWPKRWHPYTRFRWEGQPGSIFGRSLVSKLLPKLKRVNAIDTALIMWRRTVPIATWIVPKGTAPVEDQWTGRPGGVWQYDPRRTANAKPEPVYPPPFPSAAMDERALQIAEMESMAGTESILHGERPVGVNSAMMLDVLRKQALMSRSPILQAWDESLQDEGSALLMETIKHVRNDARYAERLSVLAREKTSRMTVQTFSGTDLSDNVQVRVDTVSLALVSKEAREAKVLEFLQYAPALMQIPDVGLRQAIVEELGFAKALTPQGPQIDRVKKMVSLLKQSKFELIIPFIEDDPYIFHTMLVQEKQSESFWDLDQKQQLLLLQLIKLYADQIKARESQALAMQEKMLQMEIKTKQARPSPAGK